MKKKNCSTRRMLVASMLAAVTYGVLSAPAGHSAPPTPVGTNPTFTFSTEQSGSNPGINAVNYLGSDNAISHALVQMTTGTGSSVERYILTPDDNGTMSLFGNKYTISAPANVTEYSTWNDDLSTASSAILAGDKTLIMNVSFPANKRIVPISQTITTSTTINADALNNVLQNDVTLYKLNSDKNNPVDIKINSNIIGNSTSGEFDSQSRFFELNNGNFDFHGDIIGNNMSLKGLQKGAFIVTEKTEDYNNRSFDFTGNVIGNSVTSTLEGTSGGISGGIIYNYGSQNKTSNIQGIFANNKITSYGLMMGGVLYAATPTNSKLNVNNSLFSGNSAVILSDSSKVRGGVIHAYTVTDSTVNISNTDFVNNKVERTSGNVASDEGNVIYNSGSGTLNITDSNFIGNTTNSNNDSYVVYSSNRDAKTNIIAENQDVIFKDNVNTANSDTLVYDIGGSPAAGITLGLTAKGDHKIVLEDGIYTIADSDIVVNGGGETGTVEIGKMYTDNTTDLTIGGGTLKFGKHGNRDTSLDVVSLGSNVKLDLSGDGKIDTVQISSIKRAGSVSNSQLNLNLDFDGVSNTIDKLVYNGASNVTDNNISLSISGINVISDTSSDTISDVEYFTDTNTGWAGAGNIYSDINITSSTLTTGGYRYTFVSDTTNKSLLHITREFVDTGSSLVSAIADSTVNVWAHTTAGVYKPFEGSTDTALGTLAGDGRVFTINGNGRGIDGNYGSTPTKGGGVTVGSGQTLNLNNVNTSNFSTFATTTMADADNKGTINVLGGASSSAANVYDNNLDFMNDGNLNFTGGYVTLNGGISNSLSTAVNEAKNGSTTIQNGAHVTLGSNAVLAQNNLTIGSGGEFTASTDQLNGIGQLAGSSVHNITNQGTLNISAGSNTLTTRINDTGSSTGTIKLLGNITSSSTVRAANLDLNENTYTLGSSGAKLFLLGAENGSIVASNTGDMQLTSPGSSTIDITDVTIDGLAYITLDGRIKADASKIMNIGNDIRLYNGTKLTLIGNTNTSSFVDFAGNGDVTIADSMANSGKFANHSLTINAKDSENNTISFTTNADKLQTETAITNGGRLVLTGNVQGADNSGLLSQSISGDGTTVIDGNIVLDPSQNYVIGQNIEITAGGKSLDAYVNKFTGNVSVGGQIGNTGDYSSITLHGTSTGTPYEFNQSITGDGYAEISNDLNLSLGSNGSISNVLNNGILTAALTQVGSVENNGTFNTSGTLNRNIAGDNGTTVLTDTLNVTANSTIAGILNLNNNTINMQKSDLSTANPAYVYSDNSATYETLTVGSLTGNGNLKIDVDMTNNGGKAANNDKITISSGASNNGTLNLSSINITEATTTTVSSTPIANFVEFVTAGNSGTLDGLNVTVGGAAGGTATITSDGYKYTFTQNATNKGNLDALIQNKIVTLAEFIQGDDIEGRTAPPAITADTFSLVDDLAVTGALGTTGGHLPSKSMNVNVNEHTLSSDGSAGAIVDNAYTLNISGKSATEQGTIKGFGTAFETKAESSAGANDAGILNIANIKFEDNTTDIANNGTTNFTGTNSVNTITGTNGTTNVISGTTSFNGSTTQKTIHVGTLNDDGSVKTSATVDNNGAITADVWNEWGSTFNNNKPSSSATITGNVTNAGTFNNKGTITGVTGDTPTSNSVGNHGVFNNEGSIELNVKNQGTFNNKTDGTISGSIENAAPETGSSITQAILTNAGTISGGVINRAEQKVINNNIITGAVDNSGIFENNKTLGITGSYIGFTNRSGATLNNNANGSIFYVVNEADAELNNKSGATISNLDNYGTAINDGTITSGLENYAGGTFTSNADNVTASWFKNTGKVVFTGGSTTQKIDRKVSSGTGTIEINAGTGTVTFGDTVTNQNVDIVSGTLKSVGDNIVSQRIAIKNGATFELTGGELKQDIIGYTSGDPATTTYGALKATTANSTYTGAGSGSIVDSLETASGITLTNNGGITVNTTLNNQGTIAGTGDLNLLGGTDAASPMTNAGTIGTDSSNGNVNIGSSSDTAYVVNEGTIIGNIAIATGSTLVSDADTLTDDDGIGNDGTLNLTGSDDSTAPITLSSNITSATAAASGVVNITGNVAVAESGNGSLIEKQDEINVGTITPDPLDPTQEIVTPGYLANAGTVKANDINITEDSTINNTGNIVSDGTITNDGTLINDNVIEGDNDYPTIVNNETLNNTENGFMDVDDITNSGIFINDGDIDSTDITNSGAFANNGDIDTNDSDITNSGIFTNSGNIDSSNITNSGALANNGNIDTNDGDITNSGIMALQSGSVLADEIINETTDPSNPAVTTISGGDVDVASVTNNSGTTDITGGNVNASSDISNNGGVTNINTAVTTPEINADVATPGTTSTVNINADGDSSTSDKIGNAVVNVANSAEVAANTNSDNYSVNNAVNGSNDGVLALNGKDNSGYQTADDSAKTKFTIDAPVSNATIDVNQGQLNLPNENNLNNATINVAPSATLNTMDGSNNTYNSAVVFDDKSEVKFDVDALAQNSDAFASPTENGNEVLTDVSIANLDKIVHRNTDISLAGTSGLNNLTVSEELQNRKFQAMTPIRMMEATIGANGMLNIHPSSGRNDYNSFNSAAVVAPVAAQIGGYLTQLNSYDEAFKNLDMKMLMTREERQAYKMANLYASSEVKPMVFSETYLPEKDSAGWFRPYASFEKVGLKNGPKVENIMYGTYLGGDSQMYETKNGWDYQYSVYAGYNGSHQNYDGNSIYQNGGTLGVTSIWYKNDFFTALTANVGAGVADASTMFGNEDFPMLMTGIASKTGYNWELAHGKFIIQPSYLMSYTFVNTFNYTNAAGVRIHTDPLHAINIAPGLKFIGNFKNGWQPYASVSMIWNIMNKSDFQANDIPLPEMSVRPYIQYGVGVQKRWGERFTGFGQVMMRNGGRNGVALSAGFRLAIGKNSANKKSEKTSIKNSKNVIKNVSMGKNKSIKRSGSLRRINGDLTYVVTISKNA